MKRWRLTKRVHESPRSAWWRFMSPTNTVVSFRHLLAATFLRHVNTFYAIQQNMKMSLACVILGHYLRYLTRNLWLCDEGDMQLTFCRFKDTFLQQSSVASQWCMHDGTHFLLTPINQTITFHLCCPVPISALSLHWGCFSGPPSAWSFLFFLSWRKGRCFTCCFY